VNITKWWPHITAAVSLILGIVFPAILQSLMTYAAAHPTSSLVAILVAILGAVHLPSPSAPASN
jgi:hypothetical protein